MTAEWSSSGLPWLAPFLATVGIIIATLLLWRATEKMAHNVIRPWMTSRISSRDERVRHFTELYFSGSNGRTLQEYINRRGITVENAGLASAVNGRITVKVTGKTMSSTFERIYKSEPSSPFRYFYPSPVSPEIDIPEDVQEIWVQAQYHDIAGKHYTQTPERLRL